MLEMRQKFESVVKHLHEQIHCMQVQYKCKILDLRRKLDTYRYFTYAEQHRSLQGVRKSHELTLDTEFDESLKEIF